MDTRQYVRRLAGLTPIKQSARTKTEDLDRIELHYRTLIEETGAGVVAVDNRGEFIFVNRALCRMIGYAREELLGRPFVDFLHSEDRGKVHRIFIDARERPRQKLELEFRAIHKDGRTVYCHSRPTIFLAQKSRPAFYAIVNDMTAYREAEQKRLIAHSRLQTLLSSTSAVFFACEPRENFRTSFISDNVLLLTGYDASSFIKNEHFWTSRLHPGDRKRVLAEWTSVLSRKSLAIEYRFLRKDGRYVWLREDMRLIEDEGGHPQEIIGFWVDITARRKAEDLLRVQRDLSVKLNETRDYQETLRLCLAAAVQITEMDSGIIYLIDDVSGDLVMSCSLGFSSAFLEAMSRFPSDSPQTRLIREGKSVFQGENLVRIPRPGMVREEGLKSMAAVPIRGSGRIIGSLHISSRTISRMSASSRMAVENIVGQMGNAIERVRLEEALRAGEEKFRTLTENVNVGVFRNTPGSRGQFLEANPAMLQMFGYASKADLMSTPVSSLYVNAGEREAVSRKLMANGFVKNALLRLKKRDGSAFVASVSAVAVRDERGKVPYFDGIIEDITDRQAAEESLRKSEMTFRHLFEQSNDPILLIDFGGRLIGANQKAADMLGYRKDELIGFHFRETVAPSERPDAEDRFKALLAGKVLPLYERVARRRDGSEFPVEINVSLVGDQEGRPLFIQSIVRDITERRRAENAIKAALGEKDILLREVHHRVKNNMQIIVSLLRLQSRHIRDKTMLDMFRVSQSRIQSMALIHEKLYQSRDLASVDFGAYIEVLVAYLRSSSGLDASRVRMEVRIGDVKLDINRAIPCGLIINELVTNSLKYAFPQSREGRIFIHMSESGKSLFTLEVGDDGQGLPESIDLDKPETLGLQIVTDLVRQLEGRLAVSRSGGTTFRINF